jgi:hypothetical protein
MQSNNMFEIRDGKLNKLVNVQCMKHLARSTYNLFSLEFKLVTIFKITLNMRIVYVYVQSFIEYTNVYFQQIYLWL